MNARQLLPALLAAALVATGCAEFDPVGPADSSAAPPAQASVQLVQGQTGPGAAYAFHMPDDWNRSLVLYVHGFRDATAPLSLYNNNQDDVIGLSNMLAEQGFAVGYSSFSENGWAVRDGVQRTHQLGALFTAQFGRAERVYLVGHSLGALIAVNLAEKFPDEFDGVLPICGVLGGARMTVDYIGNIRLLFDFLYPGVLPGSVIDPAGGTVAQVTTAAQAALIGNLQGAFTIAAAMAAIGMPLPLAGATPPEQVQSLVGTILYALAFHVRGFDDLTGRTHGHAPFDNMQTNYVIPAIQNNIRRYAAGADALNYLRHWYQPSGDLRMPMLTLDPLFDPIAPLFHKQAYGQSVADNGASDMLASHTFPSFGHRAVPTAVTLASFLDLVTWVETGVRP